jgi:hypothetical protein
MWGQKTEVMNIRGLELASASYGLIETQPHRQIDTLYKNFRNYYARMALWILADMGTDQEILYSGEPIDNGHGFIPEKPVADTTDFLGMDRTLFTKVGTFTTDDGTFRINQYHFASQDKDRGVLVFTICYLGGLGDVVSINAGLHVDFDVPNPENIPTPNDDRIRFGTSSLTFYNNGSEEGMQVVSLTTPVLSNAWIRGEIQFNQSGIRRIMKTSLLGFDDKEGDFHGYIGTEKIELKTGETTVVGFLLIPYEKGFSKTVLREIADLKDGLTSYALKQNFKLPEMSNLNSNTPYQFELKQNYPNPFNPVTQIEFSLSQPGYTELTIYNSLGQKVRTLVNRYLIAGSYSVDWNGRDDSGRLLSSGIYIYRLRQGNVVVQKKMVLVR